MLTLTSSTQKQLYGRHLDFIIIAAWDKQNVFYSYRDRYCSINLSCPSLVLPPQDQMLTKEEILENWNMFVGSQATNYGEDLTKNHDELWALSAASDECVWGGLVWTSLSSKIRLLHLLPPPQPPLHPLLVTVGQMSGCWIVNRHCRNQTGGGIRVGPTTNIKGPSGFCFWHSGAKIQWTSLSIDGAFQPHRRRRCLRDLCR